MNADTRAIREFEAHLRGRLVRPDDSDYEQARTVWNGMVDRFPALIVRCAGVSDVVRSVNFARENDIPIAVRGGGHSHPGFSTIDDGLVIDLSPMKGIRVDPVRRTARADAGVLWRELDHETQLFGLAVTGGQVSDTGIAGLTLGGGMGWLMRKHGLTCDNLLSADLVTADGSLLTANAEQNADLFWGLRGGGGNFGIVTSFQYRLHPVDEVLAGLLLYPVEEAYDLLDFYRRWADSLPNDLTSFVIFMTAPPERFVPEHVQGTNVVAVAICHAGDPREGDELLAPLRARRPIVDAVAPTPYQALQQMFDDSIPKGWCSYMKGHYLADLDEATVDVVVRYLKEKASPFTEVDVAQMGGAVATVDEDETAFSHRDARYLLLIWSMWQDAGESEVHKRWTREFWDEMAPFATGGSYVNFMANDGTERVQAAYGTRTYERLVALKNRYDPTNMFRLNQNIVPRR